MKTYSQIIDELGVSRDRVQSVFVGQKTFEKGWIDHQDCWTIELSPNTCKIVAVQVKAAGSTSLWSDDPQEISQAMERIKSAETDKELFLYLLSI